MEEQRQPEPVELIWDLRVEEGKQPTHIIQAVHLGASAQESVPGTHLGQSPIPAPAAALPSFLRPGPSRRPHLGAECCLFVEIAMHELAVLPSGDLTAGGPGR